jgi:hypothetical protein
VPERSSPEPGFPAHVEKIGRGSISPRPTGCFVTAPAPSGELRNSLC